MEGIAFLVPLRKGGYADVVARADPEGVILLRLFFWPAS